MGGREGFPRQTGEKVGIDSCNPVGVPKETMKGPSCFRSTLPSLTTRIFLIYFLFIFQTHMSISSPLTRIKKNGYSNTHSYYCDVKTQEKVKHLYIR